MISPPSPLRPNLRDLWMLKPGVAFLNHGSFGAMPRSVIDEQLRWRHLLEAEPVELIARRREQIIDQVKIPIGKQFGMKPSDFGLLTNATDGINAVLQSLDLHPGDEMLTTDHVYLAVRQTMKLLARHTGATGRELHIPLPVKSAEQIRDLVLNAISEKTKLLIIDHVTSPTALIFPVQEIVLGARQRGVEVLIDGAHVPGMLPLNVEQIGATYYVGNQHKWVCAPRGTAFLWVAPHRQPEVHPTTISHHLDEGFAKEFAWQGTRDFSGWFSIPAAIEFLNEIGFEKLMAHNHQFAVWAHQLLVSRWKVEPISPLDGSLIGSMVAVPLPAPLNQVEGAAFTALQERLYHEFNIEAPLMRWNGKTYLRVSCQVYNAPWEYEHVADTLLKLV